MKTHPTFQVSAWLIGGCALFLTLGSVTASAVESTVGITAVSSQVSKEYVRATLPDGSVQPEEYAFGEGGRLDAPFRDASIQKLGFMDVARVISAQLKNQSYIPAKSLNSEKLLIMLYWGTTTRPDEVSTTSGHAFSAAGNGGLLALGNVQRDILDYKNAKILGYNAEGTIQSDFGNFFTTSGMTGLLQSELISELEDNRYFVVLMAYDFQLLRRQNKHRMLWQTRFSINEAQNHFDRALPAMAQYASRYFGQDSHGLLRTHVPDGQVKVGEPKTIGDPGVPE
jgi:hypothetical protein